MKNPTKEKNIDVNKTKYFLYKNQKAYKTYPHNILYLEKAGDQLKKGGRAYHK